MINFDDYVNEIEHNKNLPYIPDKPYRIIIIGVQGLEKEIEKKITRHW